MDLRDKRYSSFGGELDRCLDGYRLRDDLVTVEEFGAGLGGSHITAEGDAEVLFEPMQERFENLHLRFARLGLDGRFPSDAVAFANRFGLLNYYNPDLETGGASLLRLTTGSSENQLNSRFWTGERLEFWRDEVLRLRQLIAIHRAATYSPELLDGVFRVEGGTLYTKFAITGEELITSQLYRSSPDSQQYDRKLKMNNLDWRSILGPTNTGIRWKSNLIGVRGTETIWYTAEEAFTPDPRFGLSLEDLGLAQGRSVNKVAAAQHYVAARVNDALEHSTAISLVSDGRRIGWTDKLICRPHSLYGAIYLHFSLDMAGRRTTNQLCAKLGCDNEFPRKGKTLYCSTACNPKHARYRAKKKESLASK